MRSSYAIPILVIVVVLVAYSHKRSGAVEGTNEPQERMHDLAVSAADGTVSRVEVLQFPPDILTRTRLTPEMLEEQFYYKLVFQRRRGSIPWTKLAAAITSTSVSPELDGGDVRWAILLYRDDGKRVGAIYLDGGGKRGYVDKIPVSFAGGLFSWVRTTVSNWL